MDNSVHMRQLGCAVLLLASRQRLTCEVQLKPSAGAEPTHKSCYPGQQLLPLLVGGVGLVKACRDGRQAGRQAGRHHYAANGYAAAGLYAPIILHPPTPTHPLTRPLNRLPTHLRAL
jgi:hypothetical protein